MIKINDYVEIIKQVAIENDLIVEGTENEFSIDVNKYHHVAYLVKINSSGYLQIHQWENANDSSEGEWGRAVYSLRCLSDIIQFCSIVLMSTQIYARR
jgi:hypothetical protein